MISTNDFSLMHKETREYIYPINRQEVMVKAEFLTKGNFDIRIIYWKRFRNETSKSKQMISYNLFSESKYYFVTLGFDSVIRYLNYIFEIHYDNKVYYYSPKGITNYKPDKFFELQSINEQDVFQVPKTFVGNIGYHIFPERYFNGNLKNDNHHTVSWESEPTRENFFGGDLEGVLAKKEYLKLLDIDMIVFTPIFRSLSNHKYDTIDYYEIDPHFGSNELLTQIVDEFHKQDMKIILDGVFNHIGYYSDIFQDVIKQNMKSKYWSWFNIHGKEIDTKNINYECVGDYKWMPKLNTANPQVQKYFVNVATFWLGTAHVDGWRLDVGDELDNTFRKHLRKRIKKYKPNSIIISETWHNGQDLLRGDEVDTIMNYKFRDCIIDYLVTKDITKDEFSEYINQIYFNYPVQTHHILYNLLGSHDTARFLTVCRENIAIYKLAVVIQMMLPGIPVIYYGDEIGMVGETDPLCRAGMDWENPNIEILNFYKKIIQYRKTHKAVQCGYYRILNLSKDVFCFIRKHEKETIFIAVNPTNQIVEININENVSTILDAINHELIKIRPYDYVILDISK